MPRPKKPRFTPKDIIRTFNARYPGSYSRRTLFYKDIPTRRGDATIPALVLAPHSSTASARGEKELTNDMAKTILETIGFSHVLATPDRKGLVVAVDDFNPLPTIMQQKPFLDIKTRSAATKKTPTVTRRKKYARKTPLPTITQHEPLHDITNASGATVTGRKKYARETPLPTIMQQRYQKQSQETPLVAPTATNARRVRRPAMRSATPSLQGPRARRPLYGDQV